jgi:hypothetical protein
LNIIYGPINYSGNGAMSDPQLGLMPVKLMMAACFVNQNKTAVEH